jgi:hypothetical protein
MSSKKVVKEDTPELEVLLTSDVTLDEDRGFSRPETVRIFGRNYRFTYPTLEGGMSSLGLTHYEEALINIREGQLPLEEADTVLHELLHVIDHTAELELTEKQVTVLAHGIMGMFQDNPELAEYITAQRED